jgi:uncharacterized cupredoxin-like copper-binding protein
MKTLIRTILLTAAMVSATLTQAASYNNYFAMNPDAVTSVTITIEVLFKRAHH